VPAEFGTASWYAQQLGSAAGMIIGYTARGTANLAAGKVLGALGKGTIEELQVNAMNSGFGSREMLKFAGAEAGLSATSGYAYGFLLRPSDEQHIGTAAFWSDRNKEGLGDAAAFGAIGAMNPYIGRALGAAAKAIEKTPAAVGGTADAVASVAGNAESRSFAETAITTVRNGLAASLRGPILPGVISGVPIGAINAEVGALQNGN
jgi:hypothetical protein